MLQHTNLTHLRRLTVDVILSIAALFVSVIFPKYAEFNIGVFDNAAFEVGLFAIAAIAAFCAMRTYRMIWRYVSFNDLLRLIAAACISVLGFMCLALGLPEITSWPTISLGLWPATLLFIVTVVFLAAPRCFSRLLNDLASHSATTGAAGMARECVLITGELQRMEAFIRDSSRDPESRYRVTGILAADPRLHGSYIYGTRVLGKVENLNAIVESLDKDQARPRTLVIADDNIRLEELSKLLEYAAGSNMKIGRIPSLGSFLHGAPVRPLELSDLLGRKEIKIDTSKLLEMIKGKCVMVTGAGGSIGSELCRQVARLRPSEIILLDASEYNLYAIDTELSELFPDTPRITALADVRDATLISQWMGRTRPSIVFHAAALKHVPLVESHPLEGIKTNVFGTSNIAEACLTHHVSAMVMISTDKAVNPTNVMGATKRLAEAFCQGLDINGNAARTRFITVRFGNVLGSAGSVVPFFRRQIDAGGPVTVTHPEITRYFMTIPEAVTLVMSAGAQGIELGDRGGIYLLDMGKPIKIIDLARQMIRLSGKLPDTDIKIVIVGLRPGEKLYEELSHKDEALEETSNKAIFKLKPRVTDLRILRHQLEELRQACGAEESERALRLLRMCVPDYERCQPTHLSN